MQQSTVTMNMSSKMNINISFPASNVSMSTMSPMGPMKPTGTMGPIGPNRPPTPPPPPKVPSDKFSNTDPRLAFIISNLYSNLNKTQVANLAANLTVKIDNCSTNNHVATN